MQKVRSTAMLVVFALSMLPGQCRAVDWGRVGKALVFPGMGHLGDGQTGRGLAYMGIEVGLLTAMFENLSQISSHAVETQRLRILYRMGGDYHEMKQIHTDWVDADEKYDRARLYSMGLGGGALAWWAWTVVDAVLFPPPGDSEARLFIDEALGHARLAVRRGEVRLGYRVAF